MWLWDTNIVGAFVNRNADGHARIIERVGALGWSRIGLPIVVVTEMLDGRVRALREASRRSPRYLVTAYRQIQVTIELVASFQVVAWGEAALVVYTQEGLFSGAMSRNDRQIAATALAGGHILVTRNVSHFVDTPGLKIENWIDNDTSS